VSKLFSASCTRAENASCDSLVIVSLRACLLSTCFICWNRFSMQFKSGERGGIGKREIPLSSNARRAALLFCTGQLSCRIVGSFGFTLALIPGWNASLRTISAKWAPISRCSLATRWQRVTPFPCVIPTRILTTVAPSFEPFAVHSGLSPSFFFRHARAPGARAASSGFFWGSN